LTEPVRFIGEPVTVAFDKRPLFTKKPHCPDRIIWGDEVMAVTAVLQEWRDYSRRGRMSRNMRPANLAKAAKRGSWGVGRYYFRVLVADGRCFDLYYDRAPKSVDDKKGQWFLLREIAP